MYGLHYQTFSYTKCGKNYEMAGGCRGGDRMIVGFTTTCAISAYHP